MGIVSSRRNLRVECYRRLCITDCTGWAVYHRQSSAAACRMQARMLGCKPRVHYPSFNFKASLLFGSSHHLSYFHFLPHPTLSTTLISFEGEENVVSFFLSWFSLTIPHLMQCNEANTFSLSYLFATKTFVTNCVLCWTGTSSCGSEKRNGGADMWARIGEIKASTPKENKKRKKYSWW